MLTESAPGIATNTMEAAIEAAGEMLNRALGLATDIGGAALKGAQAVAGGAASAAGKATSSVTRTASNSFSPSTATAKTPSYSGPSQSRTPSQPIFSSMSGSDLQSISRGMASLRAADMSIPSGSVDFASLGSLDHGLSVAAPTRSQSAQMAF